MDASRRILVSCWFIVAMVDPMREGGSGLKEKSLESEWD